MGRTRGESLLVVLQPQRLAHLGGRGRGEPVEVVGGGCFGWHDGGIDRHAIAGAARREHGDGDDRRWCHLMRDEASETNRLRGFELRNVLRRLELARTRFCTAGGVKARVKLAAAMILSNLLARLSLHSSPAAAIATRLAATPCSSTFDNLRSSAIHTSASLNGITLQRVGENQS